MICRTKRFHFKGNPSSTAQGTWASSYANTTGCFRTPGNERSVVERPPREIGKGFGWQLFTEKISRACVLPAGLIEKKKKGKRFESRRKDIRHAFLERDEYITCSEQDSAARTSRGTRHVL